MVVPRAEGVHDIHVHDASSQPSELTESAQASVVGRCSLSTCGRLPAHPERGLVDGRRLCRFQAPSMLAVAVTLSTIHCQGLPPERGGLRPPGP